MQASNELCQCEMFIRYMIFFTKSFRQCLVVKYMNTAHNDSVLNSNVYLWRKSSTGLLFTILHVITMLLSRNCSWEQIPINSRHTSLNTSIITILFILLNAWCLEPHIFFLFHGHCFIFADDKRIIINVHRKIYFCLTVFCIIFYIYFVITECIIEWRWMQRKQVFTKGMSYLF